MEEKEPIEQEPEDTVKDASTIEQGETTYYSDSMEWKLRVTDSRLIIYGDTYVMANITSVSTEIVEPNRGSPTIAASIGSIILMIGLAIHWAGVIAFGAVLLVGGIVFAILPKKTYRLYITTASGERKTVLRSPNILDIKQVEDAINKALSKGG